MFATFLFRKKLEKSLSMNIKLLYNLDSKPRTYFRKEGLDDGLAH